jgi:F0F1-type ATP synthase epsilon subunit
MAEPDVLAVDPLLQKVEQLPDVQHNLLALKVWSPFRMYYNDTATSVSGVNATGPFDILPHHHNFITLLNPGELVIRNLRGELRIKITNGVMQVHDNIVTVFLEV